ncbi:agmatinase [Candidatus Nomurabacteria bacterium]|nr:agmatinase [Candidatus Nomurabacteria bacterium]
MAKKIINEENLEKADVVLVSAPYEKTASSHKGTVYGPEKVVECLDTQIEFFDRKFKVEANNFVKISHLYLENLETLSPAETLEEIKSQAEKLIQKNKFVFLLGGEHSVSIGVFQALAKKYNPKDVTILQIDAHCDLRKDDSDYSDTPSDLAHSTVMRHASALGFPLVQVGIRTYSKDEYEYFTDKKNKVTVFEWGKKIPETKKILKSIKTKYLYLTIDVDGFDPAYMPGTGTPVQGGLEWWYGLELIEKAITKSELIGADIVEVSPIPESVLTEYGAAQLCYTIIANKFQKKFK